MTPRDKMILHLLKHFRVLSRDQLGSMVCAETARPFATVNRIMKRLDRDGLVTTVPQPKDRPYLYMPNPAIIHTESARVRHFLAIADFFLQIGKPNIYTVEPDLKDEYRPDVYARIPDPVCIEVQRSIISNKKMQEKVDGFAETYRKKKHDATRLIVVSDKEYDVKCPTGMSIEYVKLENGGL